MFGKEELTNEPRAPFRPYTFFSEFWKFNFQAFNLIKPLTVGQDIPRLDLDSIVHFVKREYIFSKWFYHCKLQNLSKYLIPLVSKVTSFLFQQNLEAQLLGKAKFSIKCWNDQLGAKSIQVTVTDE